MDLLDGVKLITQFSILTKGFVLQHFAPRRISKTMAIFIVQHMKHIGEIRSSFKTRSKANDIKNS